MVTLSVESLSVALMVIMVLGVIITFIYIVSKDSKKETTKERMAEVTGQMAMEAAAGFSSMLNSIAEPANKKKERLARQALKERNRRLYDFNCFEDSNYRNRLFEIDDEFRATLDTLGLNEKQWERLSHYVFYVGVIDRFSHYSYDKEKKNTEHNRQYFMDNSSSKEDIDALKEALSFFQIKEEDWIKYGDAVIEMYNVVDTTADLDKFRIM